MNKVISDILFRNFHVFSQSEKTASSLRSLIFQLALNGKLDFQKLSEGWIKKSLQTLIQEQRDHLKKEGITFEEQPDSIWPMVRLEKLCEILDNKRKPVKKSNRKSGPYPYYGATGILDYVDKYIFDEKLLLVGEDGAKWGSGEQTAFIAEGRYWVNNHAHVLKSNRERIIDELLVYILNQTDLTLFVAGVTVPKLNQKKLRSIKIPLPPLEAQKEIVSLMQKCTALESQSKDKLQKQDEFARSSMYFITQSRNKKELSHYWKMLKNNFTDILYSDSGAKQFKSMIFQLALNGKLDFQKLSEGRIKKPLQTLIQEQRDHLKKEGITFEEQPDSIWPIIKLEKMIEKVKYSNKIKKSDFLKEGIFPIIDQSEKFISGYWNKKADVFKINSPIIIFGDHTCCFKYIDFDFVLGADGVKIIQPKKQFLPFFLYCLLLNVKIRSLGYSRHFKTLKIKKIPLPPLEIQKEIISLMRKMEAIEKQILKEKTLTGKLSFTLQGRGGEG